MCTTPHKDSSCDVLERFENNTYKVIFSHNNVSYNNLLPSKDKDDNDASSCKRLFVMENSRIVAILVTHSDAVISSWKYGIQVVFQEGRLSKLDLCRKGSQFHVVSPKNTVTNLHQKTLEDKDRSG